MKKFSLGMVGVLLASSLFGFVGCGNVKEEWGADDLNFHYYEYSNDEGEHFCEIQSVDGNVNGSSDIGHWIKKLVLPGEHNGHPVTGIRGDVFSGWTALETVVIPDSITALYNNGLGEYSGVFAGCTNLHTVENIDQIVAVSYSDFRETPFVESLRKDGVVYIGKCLCNVDETVSGELIVRQGTVSINGEICKNNSSITKLTCLDGLETIGTRAFSHCSNLEEVVLPQGVKIIADEAFSYCEKLSKVTFPTGIQILCPNILHGSAYAQEESNWYDHALYVGEYLMEFEDWLHISGSPLVTVKEGTTVIAMDAVLGRGEGIVIPNSICYMITLPLTPTYYQGTQEQFAQIDYAPGILNMLKEGELYYYSEEEPLAEKSKYWHYVEGLPTPWN